MSTKLIYLEDSYLWKTNSEIVSIIKNENGDFSIILNETIFYPQGGGQPSDKGMIKSKTSEFIVEEVKYINGDVYHNGKYKSGEFNEGDKVTLEVDEDLRLKHMKYHTAGHLLDNALSNIGLKDLKPVKAFHFPEGAYVEYLGDFSQDIKDLIDKNLQEELDRLTSADIEVMTKFVQINELNKYCKNIPTNLPKDKPIRVVRIGEFNGHPDGGTQVKNTDELGRVIFNGLKSKDGNTRVKYSVDLTKLKSDLLINNNDSIEDIKSRKKDIKDITLDITFSEVIELKTLFLEDIKIGLPVEDLKNKYLSKKGELTLLLSEIGKKQKEERAQFGKEVNYIKKYIEDYINSNFSGKIDRVQRDIDITAPFDINVDVYHRPQKPQNIGGINPLTKELELILRIFEKMGFETMDSRQLDDDYNMFGSLNFPEGHPARDMWDTFWTDEGLIPTTHTSTMQNRVYKLNKDKFPIRVVMPGMCYRNEATDANHEHTLMQIEGVYVDKNVSIGDMTGIIKAFLKEYYQYEPEVKLQPAYFPFVEPGMEFCMSCPFCKKTGCATCQYKGWIEIFPCGMIHPNVLREGGIDPQKYNGFAWGAGVDRMVMLKVGINEIRKLRSADIDFLKQF